MVINLNEFNKISQIYFTMLFVLGGYIVLKKKYRIADNKVIFLIKLFLVILGLLSPFIIVLLTEPPK